MSSYSLIKTVINSLFALLCLSIITHFQLNRFNQTIANGNHSKDYFKREEIEKNSLSLLLNLPSLGYKNIIADISFLQFVQYFGDDIARSKTGYSLNPEYFTAVVNRDPRFVDAYLYLSPATSLYSGRPEQTVTLISKGLNSLSDQIIPKSYYLWMYKGIDELLFLGRNQEAKQSFYTASQWAELGNDLEAQRIAKSAKQTAKFIANNPISKSARISAWLLVLSNASDQRIQNIAIKNLHDLGALVSVSSQNQIRVQFPEKTK